MKRRLAHHIRNLWKICELRIVSQNFTSWANSAAARITEFSRQLPTAFIPNYIHPFTLHLLPDSMELFSQTSNVLVWASVLFVILLLFPSLFLVPLIALYNIWSYFETHTFKPNFTACYTPNSVLGTLCHVCLNGHYLFHLRRWYQPGLMLAMVY